MTNLASIAALSPKLLWKLDETSGTTAVDSGSLGVNGVYTGGVTLNQAAIASALESSGPSVLLDGVDDHVQITLTPTWTAYSICMWFKAPPANVSGVLQSWGPWAGGSLPIAVVQDASIFSGGSMRIGVGCYVGSGAWFYVQGPTVVPGAGYFIVGTVQSGQFVQGWVNGRSLGKAPCGTFPTPSAGVGIRIGRRWDAGTWGKGNVSMVGMWDRVLTDAEVATLHGDLIVPWEYGEPRFSKPSPAFPFLAWNEEDPPDADWGFGGGGEVPLTGELWPRGGRSW